MNAALARRTLAASAGLAISASAQVINQNFDSTSVGGLPTGWSEGTTAGGVMMPWAVTNSAAHSAPNSVFTDDPESVSDRYLTLPSFASLGTVNLDFWSSYATENTYDGWVVEASINGGAFTNIGDSAWTLNGYNNTISTLFESPIAGQRAFSGNFPAWTRHIASLVTGVGDSVVLQFRMASDNSVSITGVNLDDVAVSTSPPPPSGACCLANGSCAVYTAVACAGRNGLYRGNNTACGSVTCSPIAFTPVTLNCNFNGMVHGSAEQGTANRDNPNGYRSVSDRGLLLSGTGNAINAGPIVDADFMPFTLVANAAVLDIVHLGDRNEVDNGNWAWGLNANSGLQPAWLPNSNQTGPASTDVSALHAVLGPQGSVGVLYQISNSGGHFDIQLHFTDSSTATVTVYGPDWYQNQSPAGPIPGSGVAAQRQLGVYAGTDSVDVANTGADLNVTEAVINVASLQAAGLGSFAGKQLDTITFLNPVCTSPDYPNPATGAGFAILAATIGGAGQPACYANCDHSTQQPCLNVLDFGCFLNKFAAADTYANCDNSTQPPVLNVLDFGCFLNKFAAGCSSC